MAERKRERTDHNEGNISLICKEREREMMKVEQQQRCVSANIENVWPEWKFSYYSKFFLILQNRVKASKFSRIVKTFSDSHCKFLQTINRFNESINRSVLRVANNNLSTLNQQKNWWSHTVWVKTLNFSYLLNFLQHLIILSITHCTL